MVPFLVAWIVARAVVFFALLLSGRRLLLQRPLAVVIVVAVVARLVPLLVFRDPTGFWGVDINNYHTVADLVLTHSDVYALAGRYIFIHPYLPFFMYILTASEWVSRLPGISFFTVVRLPLVAVDVGTAALVYLAAKELRNDAGLAANAGLAYALCPLPIIITVCHGQLDALPLFFAFLALVPRQLREAGPELGWKRWCRLGAGNSRQIVACSASTCLALPVDDRAWRFGTRTYGTHVVHGFVLATVG